MHESFWFGVDLGDLLFSGVPVHTVGAMVGACFIFSIITVFYEGIKVWESKMKRDHSKRLRRALQGVCGDDRRNLIRNQRAVPGSSTGDPILETNNGFFQNSYVLRGCQVILYTTNTGLNYLIMLVVMMYNTYLFIAIILGITLGYFLFGHISVRYCLETAKEKQKVVTVCVPGCEQSDGSTPPLVRGMGASENNIYSCEDRAQTQRLLENSQDSGGGSCSRTRDESCCEPSANVKKTMDPSKIKKSSDAKKCCDEAPSKISLKNDDAVDEEVIDVVENKVEKKCCTRIINLSDDEENTPIGPCAIKYASDNPKT